MSGFSEKKINRVHAGSSDGGRFAPKANSAPRSALNAPVFGSLPDDIVGAPEEYASRRERDAIAAVLHFSDTSESDIAVRLADGTLTRSEFAEVAGSVIDRETTAGRQTRDAVRKVMQGRANALEHPTAGGVRAILRDAYREGERRHEETGGMSARLVSPGPQPSVGDPFLDSVFAQADTVGVPELARHFDRSTPDHMTVEEVTAARNELGGLIITTRARVDFLAGGDDRGYQAEDYIADEQGIRTSLREVWGATAADDITDWRQVPVTFRSYVYDQHDDKTWGERPGLNSEATEADVAAQITPWLRGAASTIMDLEPEGAKERVAAQEEWAEQWRLDAEAQQRVDSGAFTSDDLARVIGGDSSQASRIRERAETLHEREIENQRIDDELTR